MCSNNYKQQRKKIIILFLILIILINVKCIQILNKNQQQILSAPIYSIYLDEAPQERYKQIILQKKTQLNEFINYLYYLGHQFFDQCIGIAKYSERKIYEIVAYNYMYEIGSAKDYCTTIAFSQILQSNNQPTQNLSILARNLDYGFQQYLAKNTIQINYYDSKKKIDQNSNLKYIKITHAGFVGSHTIFKYRGKNNLKFALSLNERSTDHLLLTFTRIITQKCQSIFQLLNKILNNDNHDIETLINQLNQTNTCSRAYFTIHTENGDNILIEKNSGRGSKNIKVQKANQEISKNKPFYILKTNTDEGKSDPDGRRDQAIKKIENIIVNKGYLQKNDLQTILLEPPNFNDKTLMTAIIDVKNQIIKTIIWS